MPEGIISLNPFDNCYIIGITIHVLEERNGDVGIQQFFPTLLGCSVMEPGC